MRSEEEIERALDLYADMIQRICLVHLKNRADTEDVFQNVFLKYLQSTASFDSSEHEKAWFIRVTINACKDHLRHLFRIRTVSLDTLISEAGVTQPEHKEVLDALLSLDAKYRDVLYLHYYEGYTAKEIADILKSKENTVYAQLSRGRALLKEVLGGDDFDEPNERRL